MLTTVVFRPQAYKIIHNRETAGVSLCMHVTFASGVTFWFAFGIMLWNWPMMIANAVTFALTVVIIVVKLYRASRSRRIHRSVTDITSAFATHRKTAADRDEKKLVGAVHDFF